MSLKDQPSFRTLSAPDAYPRTTSSPIRYVPILMGDEVIGYLWAAVTDDAAHYVAREGAGDAGRNGAVAWIQRLRWAKANDLTPCGRSPIGPATRRTPERARSRRRSPWNCRR